MEAWIPITIAAAFLQNLRTALQKHLKAQLSTAGATFSRFCFAVPLACAYLAGLLLVEGGLWGRSSLGALSDLLQPDFLLYCFCGAAAQIFATALLVALFSYRNFAVGTAYSKTETVQTALIGALLLQDRLTFGALIGVFISLAGVIAVSVTRSRLQARQLLSDLTARPARMGLLSGGLFGLATVCYRAGALSLPEGTVWVRAAATLACVVTMQCVMMTLYLALREPAQLRAVLRSWRVTGWVSLTGLAGSVCWFTAMTLQNATYVRALGQIELVFTFLSTALVFRETVRPMEVAGILLIVAGILVLLLD
jgi:drug/metabolite transporter (DMT)-like permease